MHMRQLMSIYIPHINPCNEQSDQDHWYTMYSTLLAYAPNQICLPHWTYVLLKLYCSIHMDPTSLQPSIRNQTATFICNTTAYMFQPQICPSNTICPNYLTCINEGGMPVYIPHMNSPAPTM